MLFSLSRVGLSKVRLLVNTEKLPTQRNTNANRTNVKPNLNRTASQGKRRKDLDSPAVGSGAKHDPGLRSTETQKHSDTPQSVSSKNAGSSGVKRRQGEYGSRAVPVSGFKIKSQSGKSSNDGA